MQQLCRLPLFRIFYVCAYSERRRGRRSCSLNSSSTTVCGAESDAPPWASASTTAYMSWSPDERCQLPDVYFVDVHQQVSGHSCKTMDCNCSKSTRLLKDEQAPGFDPVAPKVPTAAIFFL